MLKKKKERAMHILLTNDDGIFAPGLAALYKALTSFAKVTVAAPADVRSGCSHSISLRPVACESVNIMGQFEGYSIDGMPADCVKLAFSELIDLKTNPVDLVVSGINLGANIGIHVFYSGTVAAAMEAAFHGIPSIAVSAAYEEPIQMELCSKYALNVIRQLLPLSPGHVTNINIPRLSEGDPKGIMVVPHAMSGYKEAYASSTNEKGQVLYSFSNGYPDEATDKQETDARYLDESYITVSALRLDLNDEDTNARLLSHLQTKLK